MKKILFIASIITLLASCSSNEEATSKQPTNNDSVYVTIKAIPDIQVKAFTRGLKETLASVCTNLDIYIKNNSTKEITEVHQVSTDDNFGTVTVGLSKSTYSIHMFAHNGATIAADESGTYYYASWPTYDITDIFTAYRGSLTVTSLTTISMSLTRNISKFRLSLTGTRIPSVISKIKIKFNNVYNKIKSDGYPFGDPVEGYAEKVFDITDHEANTFDFMFIPVTTVTDSSGKRGTLQMVVEGIKEDGTILETCSFTDVPVSLNHMTNYTGSLFSDFYSSFDITISPDWGDVINGEF